MFSEIQGGRWGMGGLRGDGDGKELFVFMEKLFFCLFFFDFVFSKVFWFLSVCFVFLMVVHRYVCKPWILLNVFLFFGGPALILLKVFWFFGGLAVKNQREKKNKQKPKKP